MRGVADDGPDGTRSVAPCGAMTVLWGIHSGFAADLVDGGYISIGWEELGDPTEIGPDRERLKARLAVAFPSAKPGALPVWAGVITRFVHEIQPGDLVVLPNKADRTLAFGEVTSGYYREPEAEVHPSRRRVRWIHAGVPRDDFSQGALYEIGSAITLFKVRRHASEFLAFLEGQPAAATDEPTEADAELAADEPNADRVDAYSRDFVIDTLRRMDPHRFERFTAGLLRAMGYRANATRPSADGGVDVIASRDPLAIEPPVIKVQCKRTVNTIGAPDVQKLAGALAHGGSELGLFVTLGAYSNEALHLERTRQDLRLVNGNQLVDLVFEHYVELDPEWKAALPLRPVLAVDRGPDG